jgi:hypothetical protein
MCICMCVYWYVYDLIYGIIFIDMACHRDILYRCDENCVDAAYMMTDERGNRWNMWLWIAADFHILSSGWNYHQKTRPSIVMILTQPDPTRHRLWWPTLWCHPRDLVDHWHAAGLHCHRCTRRPPRGSPISSADRLHGQECWS